VFLLERNYINPTSIVAGGAQGADCHDHGSGELRTGEPVIIDVFPCHRETRYNGDCTRTVVHGEISDELHRMHDAVVLATRAAEDATRAGVTGEQVHDATSRSILDCGFEMGLPDADAADSYCAMVHGTGHGIGLQVHEPPLLDKGGPALTIEPGLYRADTGGVRVENMVIVTETGCDNLNSISEQLSWA
jgi:Xaa-Pro aminopeptidase